MTEIDDDALRTGARLAGLPLADGDLDVLRVVATVFAPAMEALDQADLAQLPPENDLDPGRPPRAASGAKR